MEKDVSRRVLLGLTGAIAAVMATYTQAAERAEAAGLISVDQFVQNLKGKFMDADGAYGAQCVDLWILYCRQVVGGGEFILPTGYADSIWSYQDSRGRGDLFTKVAASNSPRKGDVVVWAMGSQNHPSSHVAVVIEDRGSNLLVFEQNGWPLRSCEIQQTTKSGVSGYLRPQFVLGEEMPSAQEIASAVLNQPIARQGSSMGGTVSLATFLAWSDAHHIDLVDKINTVPKTILLSPTKRGGGLSGDTNLEQLVAWMDSHISGINSSLAEIKAKLPK